LSLRSESDPIGIHSGAFLFKGSFYEGMIPLGLLWALVMLSFAAVTSIDYFLLEWFLLSILAGIAIQFAIFGLKRVRFRNPVTNSDILTLFEEVKTDVGKGQTIELWSVSPDKDIFLSDVNLLFKAILFSRSAISRILEHREKGKIVLAREVLLMEQASPALDFALCLLLFVSYPLLLFVSYPSSLMIIPFSLLTIDQAILLFMFGLAAILFAFIEAPIVAARRRLHVDQFLQEKYGTSPRAAVIDVLKGYPAAKEVIEQQREEKEGGGLNRRREVLIDSLFTAAVVSIASFILMARFLPSWFYFATVPILFCFLFGYITFFIVYLFSYVKPL
jgi:hypothetical protein